MQEFIKDIRRIAVALIAVCAMTSCVYDNLPEEPAVTEERSFLNIALAVPMADVDPTATDGYQDGDSYENYIDIDRGRYRIYFFDKQDKLIEEFRPAGFSTVDGSDYRKYELFGITPKALAGQSPFKVIVLANWPAYPAVSPGQTTIDDICNSDFSRFNCLTDFGLSPEANRLIPMYGIRRYENVVFKKGERTVLSEPITMLRAMAKVEVMLNAGNDISITDVTLHRHNALGYCAPQGVYSQDDYGQGLDWTNDYLHRLHLVGGNNDADATGRQLPFRCVGQDSGKKKWIAYIPEYRNVTSDGTAAEDEAYIDLHLNIQTADEPPFRIYFAKYGPDGATNTDNVTRMDIERNNIYRFTVKMADNRMFIFVRQWNYRPQPPIIL